MITVLNILLVEDNPGDIRLLQEILRDVTTTRCQITPAMTLAAALDRLAASAPAPVDVISIDSAPFDVILIDLSLPDSQGISSFITLHRQAANIPIIVLTGLDDETLALLGNAARSARLFDQRTSRSQFIVALDPLCDRARTC